MFGWKAHMIVWVGVNVCSGRTDTRRNKRRAAWSFTLTHSHTREQCEITERYITSQFLTTV